MQGARVHTRHQVEHGCSTAVGPGEAALLPCPAVPCWCTTYLAKENGATRPNPSDPVAPSVCDRPIKAFIRVSSAGWCMGPIPCRNRGCQHTLSNHPQPRKRTECRESNPVRPSFTAKLLPRVLNSAQETRAGQGVS